MKNWNPSEETTAQIDSLTEDELQALSPSFRKAVESFGTKKSYLTSFTHFCRDTWGFFTGLVHSQTEQLAIKNQDTKQENKDEASKDENDKKDKSRRDDNPENRNSP